MHFVFISKNMTNVIIQFISSIQLRYIYQRQIQIILQGKEDGKTTQIKSLMMQFIKKD